MRNGPDLGDSAGNGGDAFLAQSSVFSCVALVLGHCGGVVILFGFSTEARRTYRSFIKGLLTALCEMG